MWVQCLLSDKTFYARVGKNCVKVSWYYLIYYVSLHVFHFLGAWERLISVSFCCEPFLACILYYQLLPGNYKVICLPEISCSKALLFLGLIPYEENIPRISQPRSRTSIRRKTDFILRVLYMYLISSSVAL